MTGWERRAEGIALLSVYNDADVDVDHDYADDENANFQECEAGEITSMGDVIVTTESVDEDIQEKTTPGNIQASTPASPALSPQLSVQPEQPTPDATSPDVAFVEKLEIESAESIKKADPLDKFLPPPPVAKCSWELQDKINKFLAYKRAGKSFNADLRNRKDYRNPDFLRHAVTYQEIDEIGSCFNNDVFDPHGFDPNDFYDKIEIDMKRDMEKRDQEKKDSQKVEFVQGSVQTGTALPPQKVSSQASATASVVSTVVVSGVVRDGRQSKKSKWDKVDVNQRNSMHPGGQDKVAMTGAHALLSAANVGAGYAAFVQQKRKEAEEKRSHELKLGKMS